MGFLVFIIWGFIVWKFIQYAKIIEQRHLKNRLDRYGHDINDMDDLGNSNNNQIKPINLKESKEYFKNRFFDTIDDDGAALIHNKPTHASKIHRTAIKKFIPYVLILLIPVVASAFLVSEIILVIFMAIIASTVGVGVFYYFNIKEEWKQTRTEAEEDIVGQFLKEIDEFIKPVED